MQIRIDFSNPENFLPDGDTLGNEGEHNATELLITPPDSMKSNLKVSFYRLAFELQNCRTYHSDKLANYETISFFVPYDVSTSDMVAVQLEGYDDNGNLVIKSDKVSKLKFKPSVNGIEKTSSGSSGMTSEVNLNTKFREQFSEDENGNLTYKNKPVGTERRTETITIDNIYSNDVLGSLSIVAVLDSTGSVPIGVEIAKIEFVNHGNERFDLAKMIEVEPQHPYFIANKYVFEYLDMPCIAYICFPINEGAMWAQAFLNALIKSVDLTYYVE